MRGAVGNTKRLLLILVTNTPWWLHFWVSINYTCNQLNSFGNVFFYVTGIFNETLPSKKQIDQARSFLQVAESRGKLSHCYTIESERNLNQTKTGGILNYVVSHLKAHFSKKRDQC